MNRTIDSQLAQVLATLPNQKLLPFLVDHAHQFQCDNNYWNILGTCWKAAGKHEDRELWLPLFRSNRRNQHKIMKTRERRAWRKLPKTMTVYRGAADESELTTAISWTLDKSFADRAAKSKNGIVLTRQISREDAFAYFDRRKESEIVILPEVVSEQD